MPFPAFFARHVAFTLAIPLSNLVVSGVSKVTPQKDVTPKEAGEERTRVALSIASTVQKGIVKQTKRVIAAQEKEQFDIVAAGRIGSAIRAGLVETRAGLQSQVDEFGRVLTRLVQG